MMDDETFRLHLNAGRRYGEVATCGSKVNYQSEETAQQAVEAMAAKASKPLEAYPCCWCGGWHIGRALSTEELREAGGMP
jgi:hypothetical protein